MASCWPSRGVSSPSDWIERSPPVAGSMATVIDSFASVRSRIETAPDGRGRAVGIGLAGDPGEAERGEVDDGPDPVLGELRGAERPLGAEVGRGVGQEDRGPPGDAQRVHHQIARPAAGRPRRRSGGPGTRPRLGQESGRSPARPREPAGLQGLLDPRVDGARPRSRPGPRPGRGSRSGRRAGPGAGRARPGAAIGEGSRRAAAWAR